MAVLSERAAGMISRLVTPVKAEFIVTQAMVDRAAAAAPARSAAEGNNGGTDDVPGVRGSASGVDKKRTGKSRRLQAKERGESRKTKLCNFFLAGRCNHGAHSTLRDACKFSHDMALFLETKPKDLPGTCPFASLKACPHGVTCRYYGTHKDYVKPPAPAAADAAATDADAAEAAAAAAAEVLELPAVHSVQPELNPMDKDLQIKLRKNQAEFPVADAVLKELGCRISGKGAGGKQKGQAADAAVAEGGAEPEAGDIAGGTAWEAGAADPGAAGADGPEAKRQRVDPSEASAAAGARLRPREAKPLDLRGKLYLAPLTTVGNLPFRRVCKRLGADVTVCEMAMATNLLQGQTSEWALLRRHPSEDLFGIQVCGGYSDALGRCAELLEQAGVQASFVDVNMGCPIDLVCNKGGGSALLQKPGRMEQIARAMASVLSMPLTLKTRIGYNDNELVTHGIAPNMRSWGVAALTVHGRTRQQRYTRTADWEYIQKVADAAPDLPIIGNGDVFSYTDYEEHMASGSLATCMIARGALVKPWVFTEIKERRHWDISATERLDLMKLYSSHGLEHWGSDSQGVENTRRFLLEWMSFLHRYVPVGLMEVAPQRLNWRIPKYYGRSDLETLLGSEDPNDWVKISTMLLGPPPANFSFVPKHKSNAHAPASTEQGDALNISAVGLEEEDGQG